MCLEITRANEGGRYGRRSIETKEEAGFVPVSPIDRHWGTLWMGRPCADCRCSDPEECVTLQDLGLYCETQGAQS